MLTYTRTHTHLHIHAYKIHVVTTILWQCGWTKSWRHCFLQEGGLMHVIANTQQKKKNPILFNTKLMNNKKKFEGKTPWRKSDEFKLMYYFYPIQVFFFLILRPCWYFYFSVFLLHDAWIIRCPFNPAT